MLSPDAAYNPSLWTEFFSAELQASASLTGLLFVAVSINLTKILADRRLVPRAMKGLASLAGIMFTASLCLVPGQSETALGVELAVLGTLVWLIVTGRQRAASHGNEHISPRGKLAQTVLTQLSTLPVVVCGVSLVCSCGGGLYWLVAGVIFSLMVALLDAWVLMIEILR